MDEGISVRFTEIEIKFLALLITDKKISEFCLKQFDSDNKK